MREIKFRAWDKELNTYWYNVQLLQSFNDLNGDSDYCGFNRILKDDRFIPEQLIYINPDKKEFYVNDIIEFRANYSSKECGSLIGVLVFDQFSYKIRVSNEFYSIEEETDEFYYKAKVIGNIHQNPELLK